MNQEKEEVQSRLSKIRSDKIGDRLSSRPNLVHTSPPILSDNPYIQRRLF